MKYSIRLVAEIVGGQLNKTTEESRISSITYDTRLINLPKTSLFVALVAARNGHDFIPHAYAAGIRHFMVRDDYKPLPEYSDAVFLFVEDTLEALQKLAIYHNRQHHLTRVGVTGSNGKTIVKEWIYQILKNSTDIVRNPKSFNSQIGVPISILGIREEHKIGVFEAGISKLGEMDILEKMILPEIGVLTNIGNAHDQNFSSRKDKVEEKLKLFANCKQIIFNPNHLTEYGFTLPDCKHITWSLEKEPINNTTFRIRPVRTENNSTRLFIDFEKESIETEIPFTDKGSLENAISALCTAFSLGFPVQEIAKTLKNLEPIEMRVRLEIGKKECLLIDDSYHFDILSFQNSMQILHNQYVDKTRTLILSDVVSDDITEKTAMYSVIKDIILKTKIEKLILIGNEIHSFLNNINVEQIFHYPDTQLFIEDIDKLCFHNEIVLIKGLRRFGFERIVTRLRLFSHKSYLRINTENLDHNLRYYRSRLKKSTKIMGVVKALAYGIGGVEMARWMQYQKVDYLSVAYPDEGIELRNNNIDLPIMIFNVDEESFEDLVRFNLEPVLYSHLIFDQFTTFLKKKKIEQYPVHIEFDTGMRRLGFLEHETETLAEKIKDAKEIKVCSVFSHLAASEVQEKDDFSKQQIAQFKRITDKIQELLKYKFLRHLVNSAGTLRHPEGEFDMIRLGIGLYGLDKALQLRNTPLMPVLSLYSSICQTKDISKGETIGYGAKFHLEGGEGRIGIVDIGYADGYSRRLGFGNGKVRLADGTELPTVGNICMDMMMVDITHCMAEVGDRIIIFDDLKSIYEMANLLETIPYEILTNISPRIKRIWDYS